ncbi:MAG: potassium transporter TrkA, partial [Acidobacteria bacterium]
MFVLIAGGGRTGAQLASFLVSQHHEVVVVEHRPQILAHIHRELPTEVVFEGNATDPDVLERAGIRRAQVLAACMQG